MRSDLAVVHQYDAWEIRDFCGIGTNPPFSGRRLLLHQTAAVVVVVKDKRLTPARLKDTVTRDATGARISWNFKIRIRR